MIITIFGATGMVGKELVKQALNKDHIVKAFGRNVYTAGFDETENLHLIAGALFDGAQVNNAIKGSDAVLSVLGGSIDGNDKTRSLGMKHITEEMVKAGVERIIAVGGMGQLNAPEEGDEEMLMNMPAFPGKYMAVSMEHFKAWQYLKSTSLNWTFVCPPDIVDAVASGVFHTNVNYPPVPNNNTINSGDLAMFMLNELVKNEFIQQRVGISN